MGTVKGEAEFNLNLKIYEVPVIFISFHLNEMKRAGCGVQARAALERFHLNQLRSKKIF